MAERVPIPAFPIPKENATEGQTFADIQGMTLRDYFAGQAMTAIMRILPEDAFQAHARLCYDMADAMLERRSK